MKIFKIASLIAIAGLAVQALPAQAVEGGPTGRNGDFVPGEIIVKMKPTKSLNAPDLSALNVQPEGKLTSGGEIIFRIEPSQLRALSAAEAMDRTMQVVEELKKRPEVEYAQPNWILHPMKTPNDPLYAKQWHYFTNGTGAGESPGGIDLPKAWETTTGGDVVVAVIDTGILPNHPDIQGSPNLIKGYDFISNASQANDGDGRDADPTDAGDAMKQGECLGGFPPRDNPNSWHGTHVAGTIGAGKSDNSQGVAGINWKVKVQALRVLGKCGGSSSDINDATRWAAGIHVDGVPDNSTPAKVINMSLGGGGQLPIKCSQLSPATQSAINDAFNKGVTVVVAAGNSGADAYNFFPAGCDNVITVAGSDPQGRLAAPYSNWGNTVEIIAPGGLTERCAKPENGVLSTVGSDISGACAVEGNYAFYNGTSMAAPHVAGVAALFLAQDPSLTPTTLLAELQKAARPRSSTECPKPCGTGLLSAVRKGDEGDGAVKLTFDPEKSGYQVGETTKALALVKMNGAPQTGKLVTFNSENSSVASVDPGSATTNASGQAETTVKANGAGTTKVTAQVDGKKADKSISVQQEPVPDLSSFWFFVLLAVIISLGLARRRAHSA